MSCKFESNHRKLNIHNIYEALGRKNSAEYKLSFVRSMKYFVVGWLSDTMTGMIMVISLLLAIQRYAATKMFVVRRGIISLPRLLPDECGTLKARDVWRATLSKLHEVSTQSAGEAVDLARCTFISSADHFLLATRTDLGTHSCLYNKDLGPRSLSHVYASVGKDSCLNILKFENSCMFVSINRECKKAHEKYTDESEWMRDKSYCLIERDSDSLMSEFVISKTVSELSRPQRINPRVKQISQRFSVSDTGGLPEEMFSQKCSLPDVMHTVRFMTQELVGETLDSVYSSDHKPGVRSAMLIFKRIVHLLRTIHDMGIIHGDVHLGNIAFSAPGDRDISSLLLIDFGASSFFPADFCKDDFLEEYANQYKVEPVLLSVFQLSGYRSGRRDDLYRAVELMGILMTGFDLSSFFDKSKRDIKNAKMSWNFSAPLTYTEKVRVGRSNENRIISLNHIQTQLESELVDPTSLGYGTRILDAMLNYVRGGNVFEGHSSDLETDISIVPPRSFLNRVDSDPDYDWLIERSDELLRLLKV